MARDYTVTGQQFTAEQDASGNYQKVIKVTYQTKGTPPVTGSVTVPATLVRDKVKYHEAVKALIEAAVASHAAVAEL